jgi:hypothetical protein
MKTIACILAVVALSSCGIPIALRADYTDPDSGLVIGGGYSSKGGLEIEVSK